MANKLLEAYSKRLAVSESVYAESHEGAKLPESRKMLIATLLNNTSRYMNEAFANSVGTQRADLGMFKKFCLNLTNIAVPSLIANDLVIVHPMTSIHGYVAYVKYSYGTSKGQTAQKDAMRDVFRMRNADVNYTGEKVVETLTEGQTKVAWTPVVEGTAKFFDATGALVEGGSVAADGTITKPEGAVKVAYIYDNVVIPQNEIPTLYAEMSGIELHAKA